MGRAGRDTDRDTVRPPPLPSVEPRQKAARVLVAWPLQDGFTGALVDDMPGLHHGHLVCDGLDNADQEMVGASRASH